MLRRLSLGILASAISVAALPAMAQEGSADDPGTANNFSALVISEIRSGKSLNSALSENESRPINKEQDNTQLSHYLSIAAGTYITGIWTPFRRCNAFALCYQNLEGANLTATYTKELAKRGTWFFDIDASANLGYRITSRTNLVTESNDNEGTQASLAIIPMIRVKRLGNSVPIGLGMGVGVSATVGDRVIDGNEKFSPIVSRVVSEITFPLDKENKKTLFASLTHDCTFLGILKNKNGLTFAQHWYSAGFRFKL